MTITEIAIEPTKSPAGPGSIAIGRKASTVVTVDAKSGTASRRTAPPTACSRSWPVVSLRRTWSTMTMAASTSRPRATIRPVTDIW